MAMQFDTTEIRRKNPIKRNNKFFGSEDFDQQISWAQEYLEQQANQNVILFQVDLSKTQVNDTYVEAGKDAIRFKSPVELPVIYEIQDAEMKTYNQQQMKGYYVKTGKLVFSVLLRTLEEMECDINRGDYIGIQITPEHIEYFVVADDGRVGSMSNKFTMFGTTPYARTITCASVDANEFNG